MVGPPAALFAQHPVHREQPQQGHQQRAADVRRDGPGGPAQAALLKQADDLGGKGGESGQAAAEPGDDQ